MPPTFITTLIGREKIISGIEERLRQDDVRLMTLTGTGGVGKTLLALHLMQRLGGDFPEGIYYVPLAPITDSALVIPTIAHTLGLYQTQKTPPYEQLMTFFSGQQLLVLDNFEHVVAAAAQIGELLLDCPTLKVLVTSRTRLHLTAEHEFPIPPLALPETVQDINLVSLEQYSAVELFLQRVRAIKPDFQLTSDNMQAVAAICRQLDGLPLALELAAARIKLLPPKSMLARMNNRLQLLVGGPVDLPARQQSLRATLDWSYDLLELGEQRLFRRLAVFAGGCTLDAIEAVTNTSQDLPLDVLSHVATLIDKSLIYQEAGDAETPRLWMLESTREYAFEQLRINGDELVARHNHAQHYVELAETAESHLNTIQQKFWLDRLEQEHNNLRAVLSWVLESHDPVRIEIGLRLGAALCKFWAYRGYLQEGREWMATLLSASENMPFTEAYTRALTNAGLFAIRYSDFEGAAVLLETALKGWQEKGEAGFQGAALAYDSLGWTASAFGEFARARELYQSSIRLHRQLGTLHTSEAADALAHLSMAEFFDGNPDTARPLAQESLQIKRRLGDRWGEGFALYLLTCCAIATRHFVEAKSYVQEGYEISLELKDQILRTFLLETLAWLLSVTGEPHDIKRAVQAWSAAHTARIKQGQPQPPQWARMMEQAHRDIRLQMDADAFASAWEQGINLPPEQAFSLCLEESQLAQQEPPPPMPGILSPRETEVIQLVAAGLKDAQIAEKLVLSVRTVNAHMQSIFNKLGVNSRTAAVREATKLKLLE